MSAGFTTVKYGEITLVNCLMKRFEQEAVFDDSGTDLLYYKFTIRVVGWCHGDSSINSVNITPVSSGGDAALHHRKFRPILLEPRQDFEMRLGATSIVDSGQLILKCESSLSGSIRSGVRSTKDVDLNNGPKGKILSITNVAANELLKVEAEFEICKLECDLNDSGTPNFTGVLNNRWSCIDDIDKNFFTTRTFTGRLRLSTSNVNPHSFRDWVVPGLQPGMRHEKMSFTASEDGLHLDYTVVDREVSFSAPAPATSWHISHTESVGNVGEGGRIGYSDIVVTLAGDRYVRKSELIALAGSIIDSKIIALNGLNQADRQNRKDFIEGLSITDSFGSDQLNTITVHCRAKHIQTANE